MQTHQRKTRLPQFASLSDSERKAKADLTRFLTMGRGEDVLRENVKKSNVKLCEHLIRLVRRDPAIARKVAVCLLGHFGVDTSTVPNKVALCIAETDAECQENVLEAKYEANLCDSADKAQLADAISAHIATLEALRDCVTADLYGRIPSASL
jgi:hypothetical protein